LFAIFGNKELLAGASPPEMAAAMPPLCSLTVCAAICHDAIAFRQPCCCGCHPSIVAGCHPLIVAWYFIVLGMLLPRHCILLSAMVHLCTFKQRGEKIKS